MLACAHAQDNDGSRNVCSRAVPRRGARKETADRPPRCVGLRDVTLERTTNVEQVFPNRFVEQQGPNGGTKHWMAYDFTLAEIKQLDAGAWFDQRFAGERVLTFQEAIDLLKGRLIPFEPA